MTGPCAKQIVRATILHPSGKFYGSSNYCETPQTTCPRAGMKSGEGYELCRSICNQPAHAEINALRRAGPMARGSTLYLEGHTYACDNCKAACDAAGIVQIIIGPMPGYG